jgi:predicted nucleic acid-binding protein
MLKVVSDSSPLMNLAGIGRLYLVHEQFGDVIIPPSVEVVAQTNWNTPYRRISP